MPAIGFLTSIEDRAHGFFGGLLLLSERGRPLEFHCTTPVLPNTAQRILYGATLQSYVLCDLLGQALVGKANPSIQVVLTDQREMLGLALLTDRRIAHVSRALVLESVVNTARPRIVRLGEYLLECNSACSDQTQQVADSLATLLSHVDLLEPFERVREAIAEARRLSEGPADEEAPRAEAA